MSRPPVELHIIADSTGDTAARVARAAAAQYADHDVRIIRHPRQSSLDGLHDSFARMRPEQVRTVVFSTVVDEALRVRVTQLCEEQGLPHADLLEPAVTALSAVTGQAPERVVRPVGVGEDYFKRVAAMEFAIANDDGNLSNHLREADIVLIGVSRTGKTPLSMYLGYLGYRTANIPLVPGIAPPQQLQEVQRWKIVGLTIDPERLQQIRGRRVRAMGSPQSHRDGYTDLVKIFDELDEVAQLQRSLGCPVIETTDLALEEAAGRVIEVVQRRREAAAGGTSFSR
ncbi:phosphoenolpyruvate synthase regulatory protein [Serinicoccus chungangensis]|uniref:Putative pyruvate, phosphate dikinase regulatory protein n=1 Tax=Serinicoccus chungangensis TaxID=767452 RepID=A0A0W8I5W1_9MICO|nr:pyruvate, water dikinase regulatory protein [Serinicoccus chungangensis]KUG53653.1 phosphoenolpyruvate synthase regulatory protein [Serinicoccus chungangensis]